MIRRALRQVMVIARRDFIATVFTPVFLLFLFAPLITGSFGAVGGLGAATVAQGSADKARVVAIVPDALARPLAEADTRLRSGFRRDDDGPPALVTLHPSGDGDSQARAAFHAPDYDAVAVLTGPLANPHILYGPRDRRASDYLVLLSQTTLAAQALGGALPAVAATRTPIADASTSRGGRGQSAFFASLGIFFLTLLLASQVIGTMAEERNNKVIEILAAAVPLESVFLGKLVGMFGVAVLFIAFWTTVLGQIGAMMPAGMAAGLHELSPAVGGVTFALLFAAYFATAFLLLGSVFLGLGAQATTMREIQLMSLPVTLLQVGMFGLAVAAEAHPGTWFRTAVEVFPFSSSVAMAGHAASSPELWPHAAALAWQLLWVTISIRLGARAFRRGVLQSGSAARWWRRRG